MAESSTRIRTGVRPDQESRLGGECHPEGHDHRQVVLDVAQNSHWVAVGRLTPGLIHEINNAFCVIGNYVQLLMLEQKQRGWDIVKPLAAMSNSLERAQALTHRVAGYVRQPASPRSRLPVNDLLEEVLALASLQRTFRELRLHKSFAGNLPEIEADCGSLMDALLELLVRTAHVVERGSALTISTESISDWVVVSLNGVGVWQQCSDESLTLARQIIERQGGRVVAREAQPETSDGQLSVWLRISDSQPGGGAQASGRGCV